MTAQLVVARGSLTVRLPGAGSVNADRLGDGVRLAGGVSDAGRNREQPIGAEQGHQPGDQRR